MSQFTIYHNPRCSKSRQTLALLQDAGIEPKVVEYLKQPLSVEEIQLLMSQLGLSSALALTRTKEAEYKALALAGKSEADLLQALQHTPKLIERPIVVYGNKAVIGRPPENVLPLIEASK